MNTVKHKHHIVPKHMGGSDDTSNLIEVSVKDHADAHKVLFEKYGRWQDEIAWKGLAGMIGHEEVILRQLEEARKLIKHTEESKKKISKGNKGKKRTEIMKRKVGERNRGRKHTETHKAYIRTKAIEEGWGNRLPILRGEDSPNKRLEVRAKLSLTKLGNQNAKGCIRSEEYRINKSKMMKEIWKRRKESVAGTNIDN